MKDKAVVVDNDPKFTDLTFQRHKTLTVTV
jgi:hypothetical protein